MVNKMTAENYKELTGRGLPVIIDFYADWCGPCRMMAPTFHSLAEEYEGKAVFAKVNVDEESELARTFRIVSIPTVVVVKDNTVMKTMVGMQSRERLVSAIGV